MSPVALAIAAKVARKVNDEEERRRWLLPLARGVDEEDGAGIAARTQFNNDSDILRAVAVLSPQLTGQSSWERKRGELYYHRSSA